MKWYEGGIAEAIAHAHSQKALFCVAILGADSDSTSLLSSLESGEVQAYIEKEGFVFIRIEADSEEHRQFAQLYNDAQSPSIYCISANGKPVEIISNSVDSSNLRERFVLAVDLHRVGNSISQFGNSASTSSPVAPSAEATASISPSAIASTTEIPTEGEPQVPLEERIERAKRLAAAKLQKKLAEEAEEQKRREFERREAGRGAAELKRWQDEQEAKKLVEERRKDKVEEAQLRKRIKEQIAQDRIDRQARVDREAGLVTEQATTSNTTTFRQQTQPPVNYTGLARLQFRLPDGSTQSHAFEPESTLGHVAQYLRDNSVVPFRDFSIWVAFPRREFTTADYGTSLRSLDLLPSAALLIIPAPDRSILQNAGNAGGGVLTLLYALMGYVLYPLTFVMGYFRPALPPASGSGSSGPRNPPNPRAQGPTGKGNLLGTGPKDPSSSPGPSSTKSSKSEDGSDSGAFPPAQKRSKSGNSKSTDNFGGPDGNVHRLRTSETDSDEEKATWNGNSTQQM